ncbi:MAG TPA: 23S rRNA (guanosine(2251)-2'-O)-methyltransferase RlmB [Vicinamibacterales bacterium]|nr:23S rRNA (guanosine(2251)-2'-O)-methyltransferase RlmB [Vicinamibacterales bacterium]
MIIYGINPVLEAIKAKRAKEIWVAQRADDRLQRLLEEAATHGVRIRFVTRDELDQASKRGAHQGVVAEVERRTEATIEDLAQTKDGPPLIVVLDEVEDPQNVGAILRSVDASGASGVVRQTRRAAPLDGAAAKASAGAVNHVPVADVVNIARSLEDLKKAGVWTVGLDADAKMAYYEWDLTLPTAIVVGAEGHGLRRLVRERCDQVVSIPMLGHVGSLNVSVATAVVLYEAVRQRRNRSRGRQPE